MAGTWIYTVLGSEPHIRERFGSPIRNASAQAVSGP